MKYLLSIILFTIYTTITFAQTKLQLYGGRDHEVYLGCLNCGEQESNSIWDGIGKYGSVTGENSIWNRYAKYGDETSFYCPFNQLAQYPPAVMDKAGNFYGFLIIDKERLQQYKKKLTDGEYDYGNSIKLANTGLFQFDR